MATLWVPMVCPNCGAEDDADAFELERGMTLRCSCCDAAMVPAPATVGVSYEPEEEMP